MISAIKSFISTDSAEKLAILGDMLELGAESEEKHMEILDLLNNNQIDYITVGPLFYQIKRNNSILKFINTEELIEFLKSEVVSNKFILLKGSRGIALEKCINYL
jgi:UDP-N-acetylmuramoyl-tripeptide--D-alanyl-D-alanine ligase